MKIGVVGYGVIGRVHVKVLNELGFFVTAICDNDPEKLKELNGVKTYSDYNEMLKSEKLDAVHICTPHYLHKEMIIKALKLGVNVLSEKPMCIKREDIDEILKAEKESSAILGVSFQNRFNPAVKYAENYLKGKKILGGYGTLLWKRDKVYYSSGAWRGKKKTEGGGVLINQAIHTIDLLIKLVGEPKTLIANVSNNTLKGVIDVEDTAFIKCSDGGEFTFFASNGSECDFPVTISVKTTEGTVTLVQNEVYVNGEKIDVGKAEAFYGKSVYGSGHYALIKEFYRCVEKKEKFAIDGSEAAKAVKIVLAAYESDGKPVGI